MNLARVLTILAVIFLSPYACVSQVQEVELEENVPDDVGMRLLFGPFSEAYSISLRMNPFYLRGDFDGDGKPDYAVLVESKKNHSKGIAVCLTSQAKTIVLGAGHPFSFASGPETDFTFIDTWQVYRRKPVERGVDSGPPPKLIGEALLVGKRESASGLIYWTGKSFRWYQQGD